MDRYFKAGLLIGLILIALMGGSLSCRKGIQTTTPVDRSLEKVTKTFPTPTPVPTAAPSTPVPPPSPGPEGDAAVGKGIFSSLCNACHPGGKQGLGPSLIGYDKTDAEFVATVRQGGQIMPAFSPQQISDQQLRDILAFLGVPLSGAQEMAAKPVPTPSSMPTAAPSTPAPPPSPSPEGDATAGKTIFSGLLCNACHPGGKKGLGPSLVGIGDRSTDEQIVTVVRQGRNIMPAFSEEQISDEQLRDILAFLKALK